MSAPVITRRQMGMRAPRSVSTSITPDGVTLHYAGEAIGGWLWDHSRCPSIWLAWQDYHMDKHGWSDLAYSHGACPHGFVLEGRGSGVRTAAQGSNDGNNRSYALCYLAGQGEPLTDPAKDALLTAMAMLANGPKPARSRRWVHREWHATACPGDPLVAWRDAGLPAPAMAWTPPPQVPRMGAPLADLATTPSGRGYIEVDELGGVYTFGDAMFFGSLPGLGVVPNAKIVSAEITPSGGGYWLVGADGGLFSFGDAPYHGALGGTVLNAPVVSFDATPAGDGYRMAAADGGVFTFGAASYEGNALH